MTKRGELPARGKVEIREGDRVIKFTRSNASDEEHARDLREAIAWLRAMADELEKLAEA